MFDDSGIYLYYVGFGGGNRIYVAKMSENLKRIEQEYEGDLISAQEEWETVDGLVAEGPFVLKHHGLYYLFYSCNHTRSEDYAVGYAVSDCPTGPFRKYEGNPVLHKKGNIVGVGHNSFMKTENPDRFLCAYLCHSGNPDNFKPRQVCLCEAEFLTEQGKDVFRIYN